MAPGLREGDTVWGVGLKVLGVSRAKAFLGTRWKKGLIKGRVVRGEGRGRGRKWVVDWQDEGAPTTVAARSLQRGNGGGEDSHDEKEVAGNDSDGGESGDDDGNADSDSSSNSAESEDDDEDDDDNGGNNAGDDGGEGASSNSADELLLVKDVQWQSVDSVKENVLQGPLTSPRLLWDDNLPVQEKTPFIFFLLMFPVAEVGRIIEASATAWPDGCRPMDRYEFYKVVGLLLAMTVHPLQNRRDYWEEEDGLFPASNFGGRFGMSRKRFEDILRYLRLDYSRGDGADEADPWLPIRHFISAFNANMEARVVPGYKLCVDESMCSWRGRQGDALGGMPHVTKIPRKPQGVGGELKDIADVASNLLLRIELVEGKDVMRAKEFAVEYGAGTSTCLRLTRPWWGSNRLVCGDSAFASVKTSLALRQRGLHFTGLVKTAHSRFPMKHLNQVKLAEPGDCSTATATVEGIKLIAHVWLDKKRKHFVSTCGTTLPAEPLKKRRYRKGDDGLPEVVFKETKRQHVVAEYFSGAPSIDIHNHYRQGSLALEKVWSTQRWWHRIFATLLGIIETNSYLAWKRWKPQAADLSHRDFVAQLALQLIKNPFAEEGRQYSSRRASSEEEVQEAEICPGISASELHQLVPLATASKYKKQKNSSSHRALLPCRVCRHLLKKKHLASYYCRQCSKPGLGAFMALCGPQSRRGTSCYQWHMHNTLP